jgi:hypothetical protein
MRLSPRFLLDNLFVIGAAFLAVVAMAWSVGTASWVAFGVSTGIAVLAGTSAALTRKTGRKFGHGLVALAGLWSLIAALVFSGTALTWLVFANAILIGVIALGDLAAHEATTERVVHQLEVSSTGSDAATANGTATANGSVPAEERIAA